MNAAEKAALVGAKDDDLMPAGTIDLKAAELSAVLEVYADLVQRTIIRPNALPATPITVRTQTPLTRSEIIRLLEAVMMMNQITLINVGDKFVKVIPQAQAFTEAKPLSDSSEISDMPDLGGFVTIVRQMTNAKPSEVVAAIQPFAKMTGGVTPIDTSGVLVIRDYADNVKRMLEMLDKIDISIPMEITPVVIPIKYALASDMAQVLGSLTSGGGVTSTGSSGSSQRRGLSSGSSSGFGNRQTGMGGAGGMGGYPGQPGYQPGMNTMGSGMNTAQPANPGAAQSSFADRLRSIVNKVGGSGDFQILGTTKIIADERSNSLLVFANRQDMDMITNIIGKLDIVQAQVLIEALIVEVSLDDNSNFGVSYLQQHQGKGSVSALSAVNGGINPLTIANMASAVGTNGGSLAGGFSYFMQSHDLDVAATAVANDSRSRIISRPRIQTSHAVQADIFSGETRPYPTGSSYGGAYGGYSSIQQLQIGIRLSVLPLINPDGLVVMEIQQSIQSAEGTVTIANVGDVPVTKDSQANAKVAIRDGQTVMLGGFIKASSSDGHSGVPFLKDIPGLGVLFRSQSKTAARSELIVFIRPTVLPTPDLAAALAERERKSSSGASEAEMEYKDDEKKMLDDREKRQEARDKLKQKEDARKAKKRAKDMELNANEISPSPDAGTNTVPAKP